ncbi:MAG: hypothetical protein KGV51_08530 [Moraxellaceae bacterium]|nr:hypothetical protein [Moraxellaceae bacterium]
METKAYHQAPLPFIGQKRFFLKKFREVLNENIKNDGTGWTIVDVFGGSGLLANNAKHLKPNARVIYNDFDGYSERLKHIADINHMRQTLFAMLSEVERQKPIPNNIKQDIVELLKNHKGYLDIQSLATWLLFSGKQIKTLDELYKQKWYNGVRTRDYKSAEGYLTDIEVTHECYTQLMPKYQSNPKTLLLLDPPYLYTGQGAYKQDKYFGMISFLKLMQLVRPPYIFFSSTKSEILEYMDYLKELDGDDWERLGNYAKIAFNSQLNHQVKYEDNMIFKF